MVQTGTVPSHVETPLKEDVFPSDPQEGCGLEKLCGYYAGDYGLKTPVVRFRKVYGPQGSRNGVREKAPAAICRHPTLWPDGGQIDVWSAGQQTGLFMYIDDRVKGISSIKRSGYVPPTNLGMDVLVTVDEPRIPRVSGSIRGTS
jgi:GDP-D-mannose 3',5'-epimerase